VGEALVSFLDPQGTPAIVERAFILPPASQIGPITPEQRQQLIQSSILYGHYEAVVDRESAYEILQQKAAASSQAAAQAEADRQAELERKQAEKEAAAKAKQEEREAAQVQKQLEKEAAARTKEEERLAREREQMLVNLAEGAAQAFGGTTGKKIARGVLGGLLGYGTGRRR
jgi:hypothetical protein